MGLFRVFRRFPVSTGSFRSGLLPFGLCAAVAFGATPGPVPADLKDLSLEQLSQIEVTSPTKEPVQAFRSPTAVYVLTGEDIRRYGATTIPEALRLVPGVEVAQIDSSKWSVGIRGFGSRLSRAILVLIDGRTVYTPLLAGTYWEVQDTLIEDIDRIEVIRGPGGTIWGPNAVNGVINIITKNAADTKGTLVSTGGGNVDQGFVNFRYGGGNGNDLSYRVYAKAFTRGPEYHTDGRNYDDWRGYQTGFRVDLTRNVRDTFQFSGDLYQQEDGEAVTATTYTPPFSQVDVGNANLSGGNLLARWTRKFSDGNDIQVQTYYDRTNRYEPNFGENRDTFDVDFLQRHRLPKDNQLSWGLGARLSPGRTIQDVSGLFFTPQDRVDRLLSAFVQDEIPLFDRRVSLTLGSKLVSTEYTAVGLEPSIRLEYKPDENQTIWSAFTHALRTPSRGDRDFTLLGLVQVLPGGTPFFARFDPNPDFAPEQLNGFELGYRRLLGDHLYLDIATFYNHYHDLFSEDIIGAPFVESTPAPVHVLLPAQFRNDLRGNTKGAEIAPEWKVTENWRLRGTYSYLHMNLEKTPNSLDVGTAAIIAGSSPQHQATVTSSLDFAKVLQLDLTYRYVSALPGLRIPGYSTGDVRFAWKAATGVEVSLIGQNLLQPWHYEFASDPGPNVAIRRAGYIKVQWTK